MSGLRAAYKVARGVSGPDNRLRRCSSAATSVSTGGIPTSWRCSIKSQRRGGISVGLLHLFDHIVAVVDSRSVCSSPYRSSSRRRAGVAAHCFWDRSGSVSMEGKPRCAHVAQYLFCHRRRPYGVEHFYVCWLPGALSRGDSLQRIRVMAHLIIAVCSFSCARDCVFL